MKRCPTYLQNSQYILPRLDSLIVNAEAYLLAADVKDFYLSIPTHERLEALRILLQRQEHWDPQKIDFIRTYEQDLPMQLFKLLTNLWYSFGEKLCASLCYNLLTCLRIGSMDGIQQSS
jgi:hypothetical protein